MEKKILEGGLFWFYGKGTTKAKAKWTCKDGYVKYWIFFLEKCNQTSKLKNQTWLDFTSHTNPITDMAKSPQEIIYASKW